ncbi:hypothetical protein DY000_02045081 [Brassica cretica]|uniref:Peroxin-7 n=1 Tax=Brassica cretica TaxID=69181 RepID=A0ABQ7F6Y6_BRACR|nr:hypothetical protein DY000_02045081 [Brassica cretica]
MFALFNLTMMVMSSFLLSFREEISDTRHLLSRMLLEFLLQQFVSPLYPIDNNRKMLRCLLSWDAVPSHPLLNYVLQASFLTAGTTFDLAIEVLVTPHEFIAPHGEKMRLWWQLNLTGEALNKLFSYLLISTSLVLLYLLTLQAAADGDGDETMKDTAEPVIHLRKEFKSFGSFHGRSFMISQGNVAVLMKWFQGSRRRFRKEYSSIWHRWRYKTLECASVLYVRDATDSWTFPIQGVLFCLAAMSYLSGGNRQNDRNRVKDIFLPVFSAASCAAALSTSNSLEKPISVLSWSTEKVDEFTSSDESPGLDLPDGLLHFRNNLLELLVDICQLLHPTTFIWGGVGVFASVSADGSVRVFDLRDKEHSTIIYESSEPDTPLVRLGWNKQDPRRAWAPHSSSHICTAGDDSQALIWDISSTGQQQVEGGLDPILAYTAGAEIEQLQWSSSQPDWVAIAFSNKLIV